MDIDHRNLKGGTYTTRSGIAATQEARPTSDQNGAGGDGSCGHDFGNFEFGCNLLGGGGLHKEKNFPTARRNLPIKKKNVPEILPIVKVILKLRKALTQDTYDIKTVEGDGTISRGNYLPQSLECLRRLLVSGARDLD